MSFKYPWEEGTVLGAVHAPEDDAELADEQARRLEKGAANDWKAPSQAFVEDVNKYGRDAWVYFQVQKLLGVAMLVSALFALPLLVHAARGTAVKQTDLAATLSRLTLVNADAFRGLEVGPFELGFRGWPLLGVLAAWQTIAILAPLFWLRCWRVPEAYEHPDLRMMSTADFAVEVDGLLPMLPVGEHQRYDIELVRHFEAVLQEVTGDGSPSFVCELVLVRDFGQALLAAQQLTAAKVAQNQMDAAPEAGKTISRWRGTQQTRLRMQVEELTQQLEEAKVLEADRAVRRAYVVFGSQQERAAMLRAFRWSRLPLLWRWIQPRRLYFNGRGLRVRPAPDPGDITWAHFDVSGKRRALWRLFTVVTLLVMLLTSAGVCLVIFWLFLGIRGSAAAQCGAGSLPSTWLDAFEFCLGPLHGVEADSTAVFASGEAGCDCFCADPADWLSSSDQCRQLGGTSATLAVLLCAAVTEATHWAHGFVLPRLVRRWRSSQASDEGLATLSFVTLGQSLTPFSATIGLFAMKVALLLNRTSGVAQPLLWEVDRSWYLHAAPVVMIWCSLRWLAPVAALLRSCTGYKRLGEVFELRHSYTAFLSVSFVSIVLQPLCPVLAFLAAVGLLVRVLVERREFLQVRAAATAHSFAGRRFASVAIRFLWSAAALNSALAAWAYGHRGISGDDTGSGFPALSPGRFLALAAIPTTLACLLATAMPAFVTLHRTSLWTVGRWPSMPKPSALTFQEAWLMMRHEGILATYQMNEHPSYRGTTLLQDLQPQPTMLSTGGAPVAAPAGSAASCLNRAHLDKIASLAAVGDKAPTRPQSRKT